MKSKIFFGCFILMFLFLPRGVHAGSPQAAVNEFYKYHFAHDMGFTPENLKEREKWLTPQLKQACQKYFAIPQQPDEAPFINGDPFTGSQEYPDTFSLQEAKVSRSSARINLTFQWKEAEPRKAAVMLKKLNGRWLIDDVEFMDQESFRQLLAGASAAKK